MLTINCKVDHYNVQRAAQLVMKHHCDQKFLDLVCDIRKFNETTDNGSMAIKTLTRYMAVKKTHKMSRYKRGPDDPKIQTERSAIFRGSKEPSFTVEDNSREEESYEMVRDQLGVK